MPADPEQDLVGRLPQVGENTLSQLLLTDFGDRPVLMNMLERLRSFVECPHDAISAFNNFPSVEPG